jgi:hypothetical protein
MLSGEVDNSWQLWLMEIDFKLLNLFKQLCTQAFSHWLNTI